MPFNPAKDIPDLSEKVIFITGGLSLFCHSAPSLSTHSSRSISHYSRRYRRHRQSRRPLPGRPQSCPHLLHRPQPVRGRRRHRGSATSFPAVRRPAPHLHPMWFVLLTRQHPRRHRRQLPRFPPRYLDCQRGRHGYSAGPHGRGLRGAVRDQLPRARGAAAAAAAADGAHGARTWGCYGGRGGGCALCGREFVRAHASSGAAGHLVRETEDTRRGH